ncbi:MAG: serine O-acetyltransferase EpsC [Paludibacter sp.]
MKASLISVIQKNISLLISNDVNEYKYIPLHDKPLPSLHKLGQIIDLFRSIIFPGYYGDTVNDNDTLGYHIGVNMERLYNLLSIQVQNGLCFNASEDQCIESQKLASDIAKALINKLPELKRIVSTDIKATFDSDPAAKSYGEVIFCYPTIRAVFNYRIAHELLKLGVPVIPRVITELAHSETGIDIHPGAKIGEYFTIDHGTGVVIGETSIIGNRVKLYQGVTLGAKSFTLDEKGNPLNTPRHPILEDNVVVYANTSILGRITIGRDSIIGGNVWLTNSVPPGSRILQSKAIVSSFSDGLGI